jgi:hypothetical protein
MRRSAFAIPGLATVGATPTDSGIQRRNRSSLTSETEAAVTQPQLSARGVVGGGPSRASSARASATEV